MLDATRGRRLLAEFDFESLFIEELGWDRYGGHLDITVDGSTYQLEGVAEKRGMVAFVLRSTDGIPDSPTRRRVERQAARSVHEHLIIYVDGAGTTQIWQWVRREPGRPIAVREHPYRAGQSGEALIQKLDAIAFSLDEEASVSIVDVTQRARSAFDVERITKRFYDRFKAEHDRFLKFISGLANQDDLEWYASVTLNRLMFIYFIQKKGFLDGDRDYLRTRLGRIQQQAGKDQFHSFYRHFLLRLFHEGLGQRERSNELDGLLGNVPYLNGGLFDVHELERANPDIQIPDTAFERLFDFFDSYQWHLDDRPLRADNEVNPDVLGYIFEKYVNQKQMGAYYTKEDITDYIARNTVLPCLFERIEAANGDALATLRALLHGEPERYIPSDALHGVESSLPPEVDVGIGDPSQRTRWDSPAPASLALPTETWREVIARRRYVADARELIANGHIAGVTDVVAPNLDLHQLAQDLVDGCESAEQLSAVYGSLERLSILDPTCGSGAFLFAVLNLLEPLYEAAIERMEALASASEADAAPFDDLLERIRAHPNRRFFILKSIVVNNLFGVDVMEEAVEICKLRLFLKLVAQVDELGQLEPLPDIDFNVRAGNSLVGFSSDAELDRAFESRIDVGTTSGNIIERIAVVDTAFRDFRRLQLDQAVVSEAVHAAKTRLREHLYALRTDLDAYLAAQYGVTPGSSTYEAWWRNHVPFHWFVEFHEIMAEGGFDVVIGNPPYVEYRKVRDQYTVIGFETEPCGDLYAFVMERSTKLLKPDGWFGMIVPVSVVSADGFQELRDVLKEAFGHSWTLSFAERPSKLFTGVEKRLTIWLGSMGQNAAGIWSSPYRRWFAEERPHLFATARLVQQDNGIGLVNGAIPKIGTSVDLEILRALAGKRAMARYLRKHGEHVIYYTRKLRYFITFVDFVPGIRDASGRTLEPTELKELRFETRRERDCALAALNSNLFFWFFSVFSDVRNVNRREIEAFPCSLDEIDDATASALSGLASSLMADFNEHSKWITSDYGKHGVLTIQSFQPRLSKPIIDEIDRALAAHYGLDADELDFILSFDAKYRLGASESTDAEEDEA